MLISENLKILFLKDKRKILSNLPILIFTKSIEKKTSALISSVFWSQMKWLPFLKMLFI